MNRFIFTVMALLFSCSLSQAADDLTEALAVTSAIGEGVSWTDNAFSNSRTEQSWQFLLNMGLGVPFVSASENQTKLESHSGVGVPLNFSLAAYHPRSSEGQGHWGYVLNVMTYHKSNLSMVGNDSASFNYALIGGSYLHYLTDDRRYFARSSLGLAGATYKMENPDATPPANQENLTEYINGLGASLEVGGTFNSESYPRLFTYSGSVTMLTATNPIHGSIKMVYVSGNVGLLF